MDFSKTLFVPIISGLILLSVSPLQAGPLKRNLLISYSTGQGISAEKAEYLQAELSGALSITGKVMILEGEKAKPAKEALQKKSPEEGRRNPAETIKAGASAGAHLVARINIEALGLEEEKEQPTAIARAAVTLDLYDVAAGTYLGTQHLESRQQAKAAIVKYQELLQPGTASYTKSPLGIVQAQVIRDAASRIIAAVDKVRWQGSVVEVIDGFVYGNVGRDAGIKAGDRFAVIKPGKELSDPATGIVLGIADRQIATVRVIGVEDSYFIGSSSDADKIERGYFLREE
ncbi:MAG: hypothetical protein PHT33_14970 [bacterium]|nr:hypothetical protein [bacterium]